jgi:Phosphotransferase enzyme family
MDESRVEVAQLLRRDPHAWTALLSSQPGLEDVIVTAVTGQPVLRKLSPGDDSPRVTRYLLVLANQSDAITLIGKETTADEVRFYRDIAPNLPTIAPYCYFAHLNEDRGWIVLDDVPNNVSRGHWSAQDVEEVIEDMTTLHSEYWNQPNIESRFPWLSHFVDRERIRYAQSDLRNELGPYFEEGPAALVSDHALRHLGRLAPRFIQAANGLAVMRALGGWPGVLGESHLAAVSDLLDDPVPMLDPLTRLPQTLLHGDMHIYHWHLTLFAERRLLDWSSVTLGPAINDLVSFMERFDLLITDDYARPVYARKESPIDEETMIDSYMLAMKAELGPSFDARAFRQAIPAARCLHIILNWFPYFADWFDKMPDVYTWQRLNRMTIDENTSAAIRPMLVYRPFLKRTFRRFLQAYRML